MHMTKKVMCFMYPEKMLPSVIIQTWYCSILNHMTQLKHVL